MRGSPVPLQLLRASKNQVQAQWHGPPLVTERVAQIMYLPKWPGGEMGKEGAREGQGL